MQNNAKPSDGERLSLSSPDARAIEHWRVKAMTSRTGAVFSHQERMPRALGGTLAP